MSIPVEQWLAARTVSEVGQWLVRGFRSGDFAPMELEADPSAELQVAAVFKRCDDDTRQKIREALALALGEWLVADGVELFQHLLYLASNIRATPVLFVLSGIVERHFLDSRPLDDDEIGAWIIAAGFIAGLAGVTAANELMERLYFVERTPKQVMATLFRGICAGKPGEFPRYLPRYVDCALENPSYYEAGVVLAKLIRSVQLEVFADKLHLMGSEAVHKLIRLLSKLPKRPIKILWRGSAPSILGNLQGSVREISCTWRGGAQDQSLMLACYTAMQDELQNELQNPDSSAPFLEDDVWSSTPMRERDV
jgi:hypothetical protein